MAFTYYLNESTLNWATASRRLLTLLTNHGWTLMGNGDGLSAFSMYSGTWASPTAATLVLTTSSPGSEGVANANTNRLAWWWVRSPDNSREITFQRSTINVGVDLCAIKYSPVGFPWGVGGYGDSLSKSGSTVTLTDAAGSFVAGDNGKTIRIEEAFTSGNNGEFTITYISATQLSWTNASGATESFTGKWFINRNPTATLSPVGHQEFLVIGTNREIPTGITWAGNLGTGVQKWDFTIGGAAEDYAFAAIGRNSGGYPWGGLIYDRLTGADAADQDPTIIWGPRGNSGGATDSVFKAGSQYLTDQRSEWAAKFQNGSRSSGNSDWAWGYQYNPSTEFAAAKHNIPRPAPPGLKYDILDPGGSNPYDSNYDIIEPAYWGRVALPSATGTHFLGACPTGGLKGISRLIKGQGSTTGAAQYDTNAALTRVHVGGGYWMIWDGSTTPVL